MVPKKQFKEELKCKQLRVLLNRISDDVFRKYLTDTINLNHTPVQFSFAPSLQKKSAGYTQHELFKEIVNESPTVDSNFASESTSIHCDNSSKELENSLIDFGVTWLSNDTHIKAKTNCNVSEKSNTTHQMNVQKITFSDQDITEKDIHTLRDLRNSLETQGTVMDSRNFTKTINLHPKQVSREPALKDFQIVCEKLPYYVYQIYSKHIFAQKVLESKQSTCKSQNDQSPGFSTNCDKSQGDKLAKSIMRANLVKKVDYEKNLKSNVKFQSKTSHSHLSRELTDKKTDPTNCTKKTKTKYSNKTKSKDLGNMQRKPVLKRQCSDKKPSTQKIKKALNALSPAVKASQAHFKKMKSKLTSKDTAIDNKLQTGSTLSSSLKKNVKPESVSKRCKYCRRRARNKFVNKTKVKKRIKISNKRLSASETVSDFQNTSAKDSDPSVENVFHSRNVVFDEVERKPEMISTDASENSSNEKRNFKDLNHRCKCHHLSKSKLKVKRRKKMTLVNEVGALNGKKCANKISSNMPSTENVAVGVKSSLNIAKKHINEYSIDDSDNEYTNDDCRFADMMEEKANVNCVNRIQSKENITALNEVPLVNISFANASSKSAISSAKAFPSTLNLSAPSKNCVKKSQANTFKAKKKEIVHKGYKCVKLLKKFYKLNHVRSKSTTDNNVLMPENATNSGKNDLSSVSQDSNFGVLNKVPFTNNMSSKIVISYEKALPCVQNLKTGNIKNISKNCLPQSGGKKRKIISEDHNHVKRFEKISKLNLIKNKKRQSSKKTSDKTILESKDETNSHKNCLSLVSQNSLNKVVGKCKKSLHSDYIPKESKIAKLLKRKLENQMKKLERKRLTRQLTKKGTSSQFFHGLENMTAIQFISLLSQHKKLALYFTKILNESFVMQNSLNSEAKVVLHDSNVGKQNVSENKLTEDISVYQSNPSSTCKTLSVVLSRLSDSNINSQSNATLANTTSFKETESLKNNVETGTPVKSLLKKSNQCRSPVPKKVTFNLDFNENEDLFDLPSSKSDANVDDVTVQATDSLALKIDSCGLKPVKIVLKPINVKTNLYAMEKRNCAKLEKVNSPARTALNYTNVSEIVKIPFGGEKVQHLDSVNEWENHVSPVFSKEPLKSFNESNLSCEVVLSDTSSDESVIELFDSNSSNQVVDLDPVGVCMNGVIATSSKKIQKENVESNKEKPGKTRSKMFLKKYSSLKYQLGFLHKVKKNRIQHALRLHQRGVGFKKKPKKFDEDLKKLCHE